MEKSSPRELDSAQTSRQFKGIRLREWGKWVSEIRLPKSREKIYLGSYNTAEQAARSFDAAMYCLRGPNAKFNFPDSVPAIPFPCSLSRQEIQVAAAKYALNELPSIPSPCSLSRQEIQVAAAKYALNELPSTTPPLHSNIESSSKGEPSQSSSVSEMELSSDHQEASEELAFWKSLFALPDGAEHLNLEKIPSIDEALALELIPPTSQEEEVDMSVDPTALWHFEDF